MKYARLESHCHSLYSFDSGLTINNIVSQCKKRRIDKIIICDHDICGITDKDEILFKNAGIDLYKAIEFTTKEGAHIIGVSDNIKSLEKERNTYSVREIIEALKANAAKIIIPHPNHETGIIGNGKVHKADIEYALQCADAIEKENFRYGITNEEALGKYSYKAKLYGSDAHSKRYVGAFCNEIILNDNEEKIIKNNNISPTLYRNMRKFKAGRGYQACLKLISPEKRRKIKNKLLGK